MVVDDDVEHGKSVQAVLAAHNYPATVKSSGQDGLNALLHHSPSSQPFSVLILDLHIPDLMGVEILRRLNDAKIKIKTIVLSGEEDLDTVAPILQLGAFDYLRKPCKPDVLLASVNKALGQAQLEVELAAMHDEAEANADLYGFLLNASPDLVYLLDQQGNIRFVNQQIERIFNLDSGAVMGQNWQNIFADHPEILTSLENQFDERRTGIRATIATEFSFDNDLGTHHDLELSAIGLYEGRDVNHTGDFLGTYGVLRDITEVRRTQSQLQQSQKKFYSLFMDSPDAIFIARVDDGVIIESNPNFATIYQSFGATSTQTDRYLWTEDAPRERFIEGLNAHPNHYEWTFERASEVPGLPNQYFEIRARRIELEERMCVVAILRDRSRERRAEQDRLTLQEQLQQAGRMEAIGQVAGGIAHDFNNILASIIGYAELVMNARNRLESAQVDQYLSEVVTAGHRARDLISQMLTFTKAQRGDVAQVDITQSILDVSRMLRAAIPTTIEINTEFDPGVPEVWVDPVQIQQVVINLLINARDAIDGNGQIDISVSQTNTLPNCVTCGEPIDNECVVISVSDTGHGIPPSILQKVFEMYFTTRPPDKGTGFGLWMINNMVHEHQGHVVVESVEGQGTTFQICLPTQSAAAVSAENPGLIAAPQIQGRIVVVDDEVSVANFIGEVLRDKGFPTVVFSESPQALDYLADHLDSVALLLTDGSMPLISGIDLIEYVRSQKPELPVIFITAYSQATDEQALQRLDVNRYLHKPFGIDEMLEAVGELIHTQQTQTSLSE
ncbi:MAG: response regulator [Pseudomonadota bacterium]